MSITQIGKYEVVTTLGRGSMGVVYKARDPEIGRIVAIKTLRSVFLADDAAGQEALQRFRQESRSAGRLRHPNIVTIFEAGKTDDGSPFIVMEFIEGKGLEATLSERAPIDIVETLHYLGQIGSAIDYAHSQNVIHRDIKPSNVIIDTEHRPHLLDFGVAKLSDTSLTPAGTVVGTPSYMSPEQIRGETLDGATDRFALAVMAFEMATGKRPFPGNDFTTVVSNIIHKPPLSFTETGTTLPSALEKVFEQALAKDRVRRFKTCLEMISAMGKVFNLVVDGSGVVGYRVGMTIADVASVGVGDSDRTIVQTLSPSAKVALEERAEVLKSSSVSMSGSVSKDLKNEAQPLTPPGPGSVSQASGPANSANLAPGVKEGSGGGLVIIGSCVLGLIILGAGLYFAPEPRARLAALISSFRGESTYVEDEDNESTAEPTLAPAVATVVTLATVAATSTPEPTSTPQPNLEAISAKLVDELHAASGDETRLRAAIVASAAASPSEVTPVLLSFLQHPSFKVRIEVLKVLTSSEKFKTREVLGAVVDSLNDDDYLVRGFTARFLASVPSQGALKILERRRAVEQHDSVNKVLDDGIAKLKTQLKL